MTRILKNSIPAASIAFSLGILSICIINIVYATDLRWFSIGCLQFAVYIILTLFADNLAAKINFKSFLAHFLTEVSLDYPLLLAFIYFGKWFPFNARHIIRCSILFLVIMACTHLYSYRARQAEANELNSLIATYQKS